MPQNLGCVAEPFAVLRLARLCRLYLAGGDKVCELLLSADNVHGILLAKSKV